MKKLIFILLFIPFIALSSLRTLEVEIVEVRKVNSAYELVAKNSRSWRYILQCDYSYSYARLNMEGPLVVYPFLFPYDQCTNVIKFFSSDDIHRRCLLIDGARDNFYLTYCPLSSDSF